MKNEKYENKKLGVSFELPKSLTVREQLAIKSRMVIMFDVDDYYLVFWNSIQKVIKNWECEAIPEPNDLDLGKETDPNITNIIFWVCGEADVWFQGLGSVSKN